MGSKAVLANSLHQIGLFSEAETAFNEAEASQREAQPEIPHLYSKAGYQYCDLLMSQGKHPEVLARMTQLQKLLRRSTGASLLDFALIHLYFGQVYLFKAQQKAKKNLFQATDSLNRAVNGLRHAGQLYRLPRGLLARAELYIFKRDFSRAHADLGEAWSIAVRGSMGLHQADCQLGYARLFMTQGEKKTARESWVKAKEMIERMGYHRRDKDVEEIGRLLGEMPDE
jgi:tetratricopeptide (TPR) repeat protein